MKLTEGDRIRFWAKVEKTKTCWLWRGTRTNGYGAFDRRRSGARVSLRAHRVAFYFTHKRWPPLLMHNCDNPLYVRPSARHVVTGSPRQNIQDMVARGRHWTAVRPDRIPRGDRHWTRSKGTGSMCRGDRHPNARLSVSSVKKIRLTYAKGRVTQRELARRFNVSQGAIWQVLQGNNWKEARR